MHPTSPLPRTALITGASSGIGRDLAHLFAADRYNVVLVARNGERLGELAGELESRHQISAVAVPIDLADPAAPEELSRLLEEQEIDIDVLVNNAGFGAHGAFARSDATEQMQMLQVNVVAVTHLTRLFLGPMIRRKRGRILNVASTAAFQPGPLMAVYYASKAYVLSFTEAIAAELQRSGVTVTALCPGPTQTEFHTRANIANTKLFQANTMTSMDVAKAGYAGLMKGKRIVIPGFKNRVMAASVRLAPRSLVTSIAKKLNSKR